jgi:hypothetical protein
MNTLLKWGLGVAALGVTAYVVGRAWKKSQQKNNNVGFAGAAGDPRLRGIAKGVQTRTGAPLGTPQCFCGGIRQDCPC